MLASLDVVLPPILVHRPSMRVIDGMHRLGAARLRGETMIRARFFDGTDQEAFLLAVEANTTHGLPLSSRDRAAAAETIMAMYPDWSDRAIAAASGLGAATVAGLRRRAPDGSAAATRRIGRDGRIRPLDGAKGRRRASELLEIYPEASLRRIAEMAQVSLSTASDVRNRLRRGEDPVPPGASRSASPPSEPPAGGSPDIAPLLDALAGDPSLRYTETGRALLRWMYSRALRPAEWRGVADDVPPHCTYLVAKLARQCAAEWSQLGDELDRRSASSG